MESKRWASMSTASRSTTDGQAQDKNGSPTRHKCRRCAQAFDSRNKLMRHVFGDHPPPGSTRRDASSAPRKPPAATIGPAEPLSPTASPETPPPGAIPLSPVESHSGNNDNYTTERPRNQHSYHPHPFLTFSKEQQLIFVFRILYVLFNVAMKQHEEAKQNQQRLQRLGHLDWDIMTPEPVTPPESPVLVSPTMDFVAPKEQHHRVLSISSTSTLNPLASEFRMVSAENSFPMSHDGQKGASPVNERFVAITGHSPSEKEPNRKASTDPSLQDPEETQEPVKAQATEQPLGAYGESDTHDLESEDEDDNGGGAHLVWLDEEEEEDNIATRGAALQNKDSTEEKRIQSKAI